MTDEDILQIEVEVPNFEFSRPEIQSELLPISKAALAEERKEKAEERKEKIKAAKSQVKTDNEAANYVTLTFDNFEAKAFFMERFGFGHYDLYIKGERFDEMVERIE